MGDYLGADSKNPLGQELKSIAGICEWPCWRLSEFHP
jgi:hypothetical protein